VAASGYRWATVSRFLLAYPLTVEPVTRADAEWAATRWRPGEGLSLGDRLCLALGERLDATVLTADRRWGDDGRIHQIR
jgi:ribonuclease VapC